MSETAELQLLIEKEKEKGDNLDRQMMTELKYYKESWQNWRRKMHWKTKG